MSVIDVPVDFAFSPATWPKKKQELDLILASRLSEVELREFNSPRKAAQHRIVLLRAPNGSYGYLLPGGPIQETKVGNRVAGRPNLWLLPLLVSRLDAAWTTGRDTNLDVPRRQLSHVLVIGAGALGSVVVDQIARAGVGRISIIDAEVMQSANVGRHLLGVEAVGLAKAKSVASHVMRASPSCRISAYSMTAERWLQQNSLAPFDLIIDLTGEPSVRYAVENVRLDNPVPLVIGWMEPYVAAAHACILLSDEPWLRSGADRLEQLQAVVWPDDVLQREPGCGSFFQSYTAVAAMHGIALIAETALDVLDGQVAKSEVRSWVRSQSFLNRHRSGLELRDWAKAAPTIDGVMLRRGLHG
ncbi:ThiF family adenylyltransferase [Duganella sp. BJB488]|nr:ThiF family adenylyltransferase [Duganella sp. BJB489]RFP17236.1 ThiF family adenylyltransferase [Duganella sp. BJB488]RFP31705.1 ThiF family adenylyltransferase [Duganella sp. BJB480]